MRWAAHPNPAPEPDPEPKPKPKPKPNPNQVGRVQRAWCANLARRKERLAAEAVAHTEALEWRLQEAQVWESSRIY